MQTETINKLNSILERIASGQKPSELREDAQEFVASLDSAELAQVEHKLVEAGFQAEDFQSMCGAHLASKGDELDPRLLRLDEGHVLRTMLLEHDFILRFLSELEEVETRVASAAGFAELAPELEDLGRLSRNLLGAEPHHQREEQVLFPMLEGRGVSGPPEVMRREHDEMRKCKKMLAELAQPEGQKEFDVFQRWLGSTVGTLVPMLRAHISKENYVLYPLALEVLSEPELWDSMRREADSIGYCNFTDRPVE